MSLLEIASNPNLRLALISGIATSSYAFLSTLGASYFGIVPAIQHPDISEWTSATKIDLFKFYFDIAKFHHAIPTNLTTISFATAAYLASANSPIKKLCLLAAGCSFLVLPYTLTMMIPLNKEIMAIHESGALRKTEEETTKKARLAKEALEKVDTWRMRHRVRLFLGGGAWICGLLAVGYNF